MEISGNAFNSGLSTIQSGQRRVDRAAADIASNAVTTPQPPVQGTPQNQNQNPNQVNASAQSPTENRPDLAESLVALRVGQYEAQSGARVVETADEVLGTLIDTTA